MIRNAKIRRRILWATGIAPLALFAFFRYALPFELPERAESFVLLDRNGEEIGEILSAEKTRHRPLVEDAVPSFMGEALVALEDRRFALHPGIDPIWIARAAVRNAQAGKTVEGASTLEMGLARGALGIVDGRTFVRKIKEAVLALRISGKYSKERIIAEYLNRVEFGRLSVGVAAAARSYFWKELENLTEAEQLALLTMAKNGAAFDAGKNPAAFRKRFETLVSALRENATVSGKKAELLLSERLDLKTSRDAMPYVVDAVKSGQIQVGNGSEFQAKASAGLWPRTSQARKLRSISDLNEIFTTFDLRLTKQVEKIARSVLSDIAWRNVGDYSVLLVDRKTKEIRVLIGGADYASSEGGQVNAVFAPRQVGSTLKPFTYLLAMERAGVRAEDGVLDLPVAFETAEGTPYEPKNYSLSYRGNVTVAEALAGSLNVPAVLMAEKVGVGALLEFLRSLGISTLTQDAEHYGLALTLWVGEISLYELLRAYTVFSDGGYWCGFVAVPKSVSTMDTELRDSEESLLAPSPRPDGPAESLARTSESRNSASDGPEADSDFKVSSACKKRANPAKVAEIHRILTNRGFKLREFGTDTALDFADRTVFVKTGTSRNFRDNYAVGFSKNFLLAVWSGNKDGSNMKGVSGASGAGEIFSRIIREIEAADGAPEEEKLIIATTGYAKILSPLSNSRYRFEKDTPARLQIITPKFSTDLSFDTSEWFLNSEPLGPDGIRLEEIPVGTHVLELVLKKGGTEIRREKTVFEREN